jgi:hypothetical protein
MPRLYFSLASKRGASRASLESRPERIGEDDPEGEALLRGEWEEGDREMVLEVLKAEVEVRTGRPSGP